MTQPQRIVGIDIGGANLKLARWHSNDQVECCAQTFELWKYPEQLARATAEMISQLGGADRLAVTMTGELADCFATRREGVAKILAQLSQVLPPTALDVYTVDGQWLSPAAAEADPWRVAASNWHALARWLSRWSQTSQACQNALIVDIGSTTVDVIPMSHGQIMTTAKTDRQRLERGQLVYTGIARTPVCAVVSQVELQSQTIPVMAEFFATVDDAYLILGLIPESPSDCHTADGRPRTIAGAHGRLARMIGEDAETLAIASARHLAEQVLMAQAQQVATAIARNWKLLTSSESPISNAPALDTSPYLVCTGHGAPLMNCVLPLLSPQPLHCLQLDSLLPEAAARSAPAVAVAWLLMAEQG